MLSSPRPVLTAICAAILLLSGCGSTADKPTTTTTTTQRASTTTATATPSAAVATAEQPVASQFPAATGKTLQQVADAATAQAQLGAATGTFTPGHRRVAFGLNTTNGAFIYAPTALYIATRPNSPARGPFLAPADPMTVAAPYRSNENEGPGGLQAIYAASVPLTHAGTYTILALTKIGPSLF